MFFSSIVLIIGIAILILAHEFGHFLAAKKSGLLVEEFGIGFPPRLFSKQIGETRYSINAIPFGGFVKIYGENKAVLELDTKPVDTKRSFTHQSAWRRFLIISAGVAVNFWLGWLILSVVYMLGSAGGVIISEVVPDSPAEVAGVQTGDYVVGYSTPEAFISYINENLGRPITFTVRHEGVNELLTATPRINALPTEGALGVALTQTGIEQRGFFMALKDGFVDSIRMMIGIVQALFTLVASLFGFGPGAGNIVGPVGVFSVAGEFGQMGFIYLLQLIGMISLNLAILNVVPFPALDGGRILFLLIEKVKGSAISARRELTANAIGFAILLLLMIIVTVRDVIRLF